MTAPTPAEYEDAYELLTRQLAQWGITDLNATVRQILEEGWSPEVAELRLRDTPSYQQRFKANEQRIAKGLPALSPAEYVQTERAYISTAREFGLPDGFYDQPDDFVRWLESDVSPQEFRERASAASQAYINAPQDVKEQWTSLYGLTPGDAVAAFLDEKKALDLLRRRTSAVNIATEAQRAFDGQYQIDQVRAEQLADAGVTQQQAQQAYGQVAARGQRDAFLGRLAGEDFTRTEAEDELLLNDGRAAQERARIYDAEQARFRQNYLPATSASFSKGQGNF